MATDDLIAALQGVGAVDSEGTFSFDREKAREKLRTFQVAEPQRHVLHFVAVAALKGASTVEVECDSDDLIVRFDGAPITAHDLDDLYNSSFAAAATDEQRARQQLAVGLHAALALNPRRVTIVSGVGESAISLLARHDVPDVIAPAPEATGGTTIHVKQRFRPGLMVRFVQHLRGALAEAAWLRARAGYARVPISLNGERISGGLRLPDAGHVHRLEDGPRSAIAGLSAEHVEGVVRLVRHGVWICDEPAPWLPRGTLVVVASDLLLTDLSGDKVVQEAEHARCMALANRVAAAVVATAIGPGAAVVTPPDLRERLHDAWRWPDALRSDTVVGEAMARVVAWRDIWGRTHTLAALRAERARVGHVAVTRDDFAERVPAGRDIVLPAGDPVLDDRLARAFPDQVVDVGGELERRAVAEVNRRRWRAQPCEPTLTPASYLAIVPLTVTLGERSVTGQIGLRRAPATLCSLRVVVDGCELAELTRDAPIAGIDAVIAGPLTILPDFSGPVRDELFAACLGAWLAGARLLAEQALQGARAPWPAGRELHELRFGLLRACHPVDAARAVLAGVGFAGDGLAAQTQRLVAAGAVAPVSDLCERAWVRDAFNFMTASGAGLSVGAIAAALRQGKPIYHASDQHPPHPQIREVVLLVGTRSAQALAWLFGDRVPRMDDAAYLDLLGEATHMTRPRQPLALSEATHTASVLVEHEGLRVAMAFPRERGAWAQATGRAVCEIFRAGRPLTRAAIWSPVPGASFAIDGDELTVKPGWDGVVHDDRFKAAAGKVAAAVPALMRLAIARIDHGDRAEAAAWRRGILSALVATIPTRMMRAVYQRMLAEAGVLAARKPYLKLHALAAASSLRALAEALADRTDEVEGPRDVRGLAAKLSVPRPGKAQISAVEAVLAELRALFGQVGGKSWLDDITLFAPEIAALPLLRRVDGVPVTLAEARKDALADGVYVHALEDDDAMPAAFRGSLRVDTFTREALAAMFGESRLRRGSREAQDSAAAVVAPEPKRKQKQKQRPPEISDDKPATPQEIQRMFAELEREAATRAPDPTGPVQAPASAPPAVVPEPPTPGERLIAAVQAELQALRRGHESLLTGFNLDHVRAVAGDGAVMVKIGDDGLHIDLAHPLVQRAVAGHAEDRLWVSFLASQVYTALNLWREDIRDADEAKFHARHLDWLAGELARRTI